MSIDRTNDVPSRRAHPRFNLTVPVRIRWREAEAEREVVGLTRDVSESGIFVDCSSSSWPTVGLEVWLEVDLPGLREADGVGLKLRSLGRVVRTSGAGRPGFAVETKLELPE